MEDFLLSKAENNGVIDMEWGYVAYLHDDFFYDLEKLKYFFSIGYSGDINDKERGNWIG